MVKQSKGPNGDLTARTQENHKKDHDEPDPRHW